MKWIHFFLRLLTSLIFGCVLGGIFGAPLGAVIGAAALLVTKTPHLFWVFGAVGAAMGFLVGLTEGFKIGSYLYKRHIEKDPNWLEPEFLSGRDPAQNNNQQDREPSPIPGQLPVFARNTPEIKEENISIFDRNEYHPPLFNKSVEVTNPVAANIQSTLRP